MDNKSCISTENDPYKAESFFKELDDFVIQLPGNREVPFPDTENLLYMFESLYPRWKDTGRVTSVPVARIPKLFLHNSDLVKGLQEPFRSVSESDSAEKSLYKLFVDQTFEGEPGMLVFPQIDFSRLFFSCVARVEIGMVMVHSKKGIFVFYVETLSGRKLRAFHGLVETKKKYTRILRMLFLYNNTIASKENVPIHSVLCDFSACPSKLSVLKEGNDSSDSKVLVFNRDELKPGTFRIKWNTEVCAAEIKDINWDFSLDIFVARLAALVSIEGASALLHSQLVCGQLQSVTTTNSLETQIKGSSGSCDSELIETVLKFSQVESRSRKKKFILWTKEQLSVIAKTYNFMINKNRGIRLLITGGKGSGKTMLLIFLAKMVSQSLKAEESGKSSVLVCEGTFRSIGLLQIFKSVFSNTFIKVFDELPTRRELRETKIVFCDEAHPQLTHYFSQHLKSDQHCLLFSSRVPGSFATDFERMPLSSCLRSTNAISLFANKFIETGPQDFLKTCRGNNWEGERVNVKLVKKGMREELVSDKIAPLFVEEIYNSSAMKAHPGFLVIVAFIELELLNEVQKILETRQYTTFKSIPPLWKTPQQNVHHLPDIYFCDPEEIEGCEFASILILLDLKYFELITSPFFRNHFLSAVTRATLKVDIIVKDYDLVDQEHIENFLVRMQEENIKTAMKRCLKNSNNNSVVLFVGQKPHAFDKASASVIPGISVYQQNSCLHMDDIFMESDLEKLSELNVHQIFLANTDLSCKLDYFFYFPSARCIKNFCERRSSNLILLDYSFNSTMMTYTLKTFKTLLRDQAIPQTFWHKTTNDTSLFLNQKMRWDELLTKAEKLYRSNDVVLSIKTMEVSMKLLQKQWKHNEVTKNLEMANMDKKNFAKLSATVSKMFIEQIDTIVQQTRSDFNFEILFAGGCLMKAFIHAANALQLDTSFQYLVETVTEKMRLHSRSFAMKLYGMQRKALYPSLSLNAEFDSKLAELDSLICCHGIRNIASSGIPEVLKRKRISDTAMNLFEESLFPILNTSVEDRNTENNFEILFDEMMKVFEHPVLLGLLPENWEICGKFRDVIKTALEELETSIHHLKNHVDHDENTTQFNQTKCSTDLTKIRSRKPESPNFKRGTKFDAVSESNGSDSSELSEVDSDVSSMSDTAVSTTMSSWMESRKIVTLHTEKGRYPQRDLVLTNGTHVFQNLDFPTEEGVSISETDLIVMACYQKDNNSSIAISFGKACELDLEALTSQEFFPIKVLKNFHKDMRIYFNTSGVKIVNVGREFYPSRQTELPVGDFVEVTKSMTVFHFDSLESGRTSLDTEGILVFRIELYSDKTSRNFTVKMKLYFLPFDVERRFTRLKLKRFDDGCQFYEQSKEKICAIIKGKKELERFLSEQTRSPVLLSGVALIELSQTGLTAPEIEPWNILQKEVQEMLLHLNSKMDIGCAIVLLGKFPLCKQIHLCGPNQTNKKISSRSLDSDDSQFGSSLKENEVVPDYIKHNDLITLLSTEAKYNQLQSIKLSRVELHFDSMKNCLELRHAIDNVSRTRKRFIFNFESVIVTSGMKRTNAVLSTLILLTSNNRDAWENAVTIDSAENKSLDLLSMFFVEGRLESIQIEATIHIPEISHLIELSKIWTFRCSRKIGCQKLLVLKKNLNYTWLFQLNNFSKAAFVKVVEGIQDFHFDRDNLFWINQVLSTNIMSEKVSKHSVNKMVLDISSSDSRSEVSNRLETFLNLLEDFGIEVRSLKIHVEADENGWAFFRFKLTKRKTVIHINDVTIIFPFNSTEHDRFVVIEHFVIEQTVTHRFRRQSITTPSCHTSPVVFIDHSEDEPFLKEISVVLPVPQLTSPSDLRIFTKQDLSTQEWASTENFKLISVKSSPKVEYQSKHFCPASAGSASPQKQWKEKLLLGVYVTIENKKIREGNVVFDCVRFTDEKDFEHWRQKLSNPYFECHRIEAMEENDKIIGFVSGNVTVEHPPLATENELPPFLYPAVFGDDRNFKEYKMKIIDDSKRAHGCITYWRETKGFDSREKLFCMWYNLLETSTDVVPSLKPIAGEASTSNYSQKMTDERQDHFTRARFHLHKGICDTEGICAYLISSGELTDAREEEILSKSTRTAKNRSLLKHVGSRSSSAYDHFRQALIEVGETKELIELLPNFAMEETPPGHSAGNESPVQSDDEMEQQEI